MKTHALSTKLARHTKLAKLTAATLAIAVMAACQTPVEVDKNAAGAPVESRTPGTPGGSQSGVAPVDASRGGAGTATGAASATANLERLVYFDFDSYVIKAEYRPVIEGFAKALVADRKLKIAIEGHTDERGGREYNLALGQKRAEAVAKALVLLGAQEVQIEPVSYGEERPADAASSEAAWAKNRRAEMKDR
jgi:peptidoglycan-associated lipoprotein